MVPSVATKAKASVTPPNCATTPDADVTLRRRTPLGLPVTTAYARSAPANAPTTALTAEIAMLFANDLAMYGLAIPAKLANEMLPSGATSDPPRMMAVGSKRNTAM